MRNRTEATTTMSDTVTIDPDGTYPIGAAARLLGVSASTLRDLERRGQLECTRTPGGQRRFAGSDLLRLWKQSQGAPPKKPAPSSPHIAASDEDAKARQAWLGPLIAQAQRELPANTPAEIRLRLNADLERALGSWGLASSTGDVEPLIKSLVQRARIQAETAQEDAERHAMKGELVEFALARVRQGIDLLPKRIVGAPGSLKRRHVRATLRDRLRDLLQTRLRGDESWDEVRELADEFMAAWYVEQTPDSRIPNTVKFLAVGATGVIGGAAAAAALDPRIRAAAAKLKDPLRSLAVDVLQRFGAPAASTSPPPNPPN
jgi:excisionase family DNA binding protein